LQKLQKRKWLSDLLLISGGLLLLWAVLASLKPILAPRQLDNDNFLSSALEISLPRPQKSSILNTETVSDDVFYPLLYKTPTPTPTPIPTPTQVPSAGPVVRLKIPRINVDRAVVPLKQYRDKSGQIQYDTDSLFATSNRLDLVGQVITSTNPGDGSNIVLVGHNFNRGWYAWEGVFVKLKKLKSEHLKYLGPKSDERVTLVTCGGAFGVWSTRIYVIAK